MLLDPILHHISVLSSVVSQQVHQGGQKLRTLFYSAKYIGLWTPCTVISCCVSNPSHMNNQSLVKSDSSYFSMVLLVGQEDNLKQDKFLKGQALNGKGTGKGLGQGTVRVYWWWLVRGQNSNSLCPKTMNMGCRQT